MHDLFGKSNHDQTTCHNVTAYARHRAPSHAVVCTAVTTLEAEVGCKHHLKRYKMQLLGSMAEARAMDQI